MTTGFTKLVASRCQYVPLPGEEAAAVRHAENFLVEFCAAGIEALPWELRPAAVKYAIGHLLTVFLNNANIADAFINAVADAAGLTKSELRRRLKDRAEFLTHLPRILEVNRAGALRELESWLLS